jgi:aryl-alcohol dehydrogenase-like predicted oxidoreductase
MESIPLGASGLEVCRVGGGGHNFGRRLDRERTRQVVGAALDAGVTFFDTAESYGDGDSERFLGAALGGRRADVVVATKFGWAPGDLPGGSPERVRLAIDASLDRLGTDVVDLYYYHRPDGVTPLVETLGAMQELVDAGKVRRLGLSNVDVGLLREAGTIGAEALERAFDRPADALG